MKICKKGHEYDENRKQCPVCKREVNRRHFARNKEYYREKNLRWHKENPEKSSANTRRWQKRNPGKTRANESRRRARLAGVPRDVLVYELDAHCAVCYETENLTVEHLIAISRGGSDTLGNKATFCKSCNSSKRDMSITDPEFTAWLVGRRLTV